MKPCKTGLQARLSLHSSLSQLTCQETLGLRDRVILCCNVGWYDGAVHHSRQQWLVAKWLGLGVTVRVRLFSCRSWAEK